MRLVKIVNCEHFTKNLIPNKSNDKHLYLLNACNLSIERHTHHKNPNPK